MYYSKGAWVSQRRAQDDEDVKSARIDLAQRQVDKDENVNGRRGTLKNVRRELDSRVHEDVGEAHSSQFNSRERAVSSCCLYDKIICIVLVKRGQNSL